VTFLTENFLLQNDAAIRLYHDHAAKAPILDYHNHLDPAAIAQDHRFRNLTEAWLAGDHYKWRAMRANGVDERFITGDAVDREKFQKWADTVPHTLRNPLYHWTHMELRHPFGISDRLLGPETADGVWNHGNEKLSAPGFSARGLLKKFNVRLLCTTDDPADTLEYHLAIARDRTFPIRVLPAFRPDKGLAVEDPAAFNAWVDRIAAASNVDVRDLQSYLLALASRCDHFHQAGCRLSDHGLTSPWGADFTARAAASAFGKLRGGRRLEAGECAILKSALLYHLGLMYHQRGWTQQFHFGALRNVNTRLRERLGADSGGDTVGDAPMAEPLAQQLDRLDREDKLPRTILYNLNPRDNALFAAMAGCFQDGSTPGKIQFGSAWWFLDQKDGMEAQLDTLSNLGLLSRFVGMLTDSRSFLSFSRHEYFRRILCNRLGRDMAAGLIPLDFEWVGRTVENICYHNAADYFGFPNPAVGTPG